MIQEILSIAMLAIMAAFELRLLFETRDLLRTLKELLDEERYEFKEYIKGE